LLNEVASWGWVEAESTGATARASAAKGTASASGGRNAGYDTLEAVEGSLCSLFEDYFPAY